MIIVLLSPIAVGLSQGGPVTAVAASPPWCTAPHPTSLLSAIAPVCICKVLFVSVSSWMVELFSLLVGDTFSPHLTRNEPGLAPEEHCF